jgi:uncharacterized protein (TIGR00369 family)
VNDDTAKIGIVPAEVMLSQDGLSFLRAMINGELPAPPITQTLGFELVEVEEGRAVFAGIPEMRHYNPIGVVHAGYAATLLDSALSCAVQSTCRKGEAYTTLDLKLNLVRPLTKETGIVSAEAKVLHRGRSIATAEGYLKDAAGKLYAHATGACMIFGARGK